ncbi:hypothetical protein [Brucella pituitosa]|uniref:hypothetical protein n=1 Tax=Brucella pituitosa TaxID=571256 RepID=UPI0009A24DCD|nr:hypothetical protein [Brucella pituitosa]
MRMTVCALGLMMGFTSSALALNSTENLQQALAQIPQTALSNPDAMQILFVDIKAWRGLDEAAPSADAMRRLTLVQQIPALQPIGYGLDEWSSHAKIAFDDVAYFAAFGQAPGTVTYWGLKDQASVAQLLESLKSSDFVAGDPAIPGLLQNGEAGKMDLSKANAKDPWRGTMGTARFVLPLGQALVDTASAEAIKQLAQPSPSVAENDVILTAIAGLNHAMAPDEGALVQAAVISPILGAEGIDPEKLLAAAALDHDAAQKQFEALVKEQGRGLPPYLAGIIADAQIKAAPAVAIALAYPDCQTADKALAAIKSAWGEMKAAQNAQFSGESLAADKLCAAVVTLTAAKADNASNPLLSEIMDRYMQRDLPLLRIGTSL